MYEYPSDNPSGQRERITSCPLFSKHILGFYAFVSLSLLLLLPLPLQCLESMHPSEVFPDQPPLYRYLPVLNLLNT